jgi:hypothetical protein
VGPAIVLGLGLTYRPKPLAILIDIDNAVRDAGRDTRTLLVWRVLAGELAFKAHWRFGHENRLSNFAVSNTPPQRPCLFAARPERATEIPAARRFPVCTTSRLSAIARCSSIPSPCPSSNLGNLGSRRHRGKTETSTSGYDVIRTANSRRSGPATIQPSKSFMRWLPAASPA